MGDLLNRVLTPDSQSQPTVTMPPPTDGVETSPRSMTRIQRVVATLLCLREV